MEQIKNQLFIISFYYYFILLLMCLLLCVHMVHMFLSMLSNCLQSFIISLAL